MKKSFYSVMIGCLVVVLLVFPVVSASVFADSLVKTNDIGYNTAFSSFSSVSDEGKLITAITSKGMSTYSSSSRGTEASKYYGYIVEFSEKPAIAYQAELKANVYQKQAEVSRLKTEISAMRVSGYNIPGRVSKASKVSDLSRQQNDLRNYVQSVSTLIKNRRAKIQALQAAVEKSVVSASKAPAQGKTLAKFDKAFSGLALNISDEEAAELRKLSYVRAVYPNYEVKATLIDSVPLINADDVWKLKDSKGNFITGKGVTIAIIDTGVDYTHPDLGGCLGVSCKVIGGYDFVNNDNDPMDDHGHGTHVAGITSANGVLKGVAPDSKLLAYKVLDSYGSGWNDVIIKSIERAVDPNGDNDFSDHAGIISMSLGGYGNPDSPLSKAVDAAVDSGVVVVVAAGNWGPSEQSISSPGTARKALTVGATDKTDKLTDFSSRGPVVWDGGAIVKPDVVAPGVQLCSAQWDSAWDDRKCFDDKHVAISGTSMATPVVSGAVALIKQKNPDWTPEEVKLALRDTAKDLGYLVTEQGYGRIDVLAAIMSAKPPIARLNPFAPKTRIIDIKGTASAGSFKEYRLYYGAGTGPSSFTEFYYSNKPVTDGILYANFDSALLDEGLNTIWLVVTGTGGITSEDRILLNIHNFQVDSPLENDIYRAGDVIQIKGGFGGQYSYKVGYGLGGTPTEWRSEGISYPKEAGVVADWDTSSISQANFYTIRITLNVNGREKQLYVRDIYLDPTLKKGWPQHIDYTKADWGGYYWSGYLVPVVSDLNKDGNKEIVVVKEGIPPKLMVYAQDGSLLWFANVGTTSATVVKPLIGDINNDGYDEIIGYAMGWSDSYSDYGYSGLYAFKSDGTILWSVMVPQDYQPTLLMADLNNDGKKEIIVKGNDAKQEKMTVVSNQGQILSQWSLEDSQWGADIQSSPAVGNFDDDPDLEIVVASPAKEAGGKWQDDKFVGWDNTGVIYVYNMDGSIVTGWPVYTDGVIFSSPAVGDINKDGQPEIVVGLMYNSDKWPDDRYGGVYVFDKKGNILPGWPVLKGWNFWSSPSLADFDSDGDLEIATSRLGFVTYVFHHDGTVASGWPQYTVWNDYYSTITGDINNDGIPEVLTTAGGIISNEHPGGVYAWDFKGVPVNGFPKVTEVDAQAPATIADIDNDGQVEVIASSDQDYNSVTELYKMRGSIYVWDIPADYNPSVMPWPVFHHDTQSSGLYGKLPKIKCTLPSSQAECDVGKTCACLVTACNKGWLLARTPDSTVFAKYFSTGNLAFKTGLETGTVTGYISCLDDQNVFAVSINVK